jgi:hypothetical protein
MDEEVLLPLHDGIGDTQDGVKALLDVLDEPARLLQAAAASAWLTTRPCADFSALA